MALNPKIDALVTETIAFAAAQVPPVSEERAFKIALVRFCKAWSIGQTAPKSELEIVRQAVEKLGAREVMLRAAAIDAASTVAGNHQTEIDAIVNSTVIPE